MEEGFYIIEYFDGLHDPLSDYIRIEANRAYERTPASNVVGHLSSLKISLGHQASVG
jgi:hypothetical protein